MPSKLAVLTDFDGTITRTDVAEAILEEFAPASWWDIEELHRARKIGTRESMAREFALLHAKQADLIRFVDDHVEMDDTFRDFAAFCQRRQIPLEIVSEGLDFYVRQPMRRAPCAVRASCSACSNSGPKAIASRTSETATQICAPPSRRITSSRRPSSPSCATRKRSRTSRSTVSRTCNGTWWA